MKVALYALACIMRSGEPNCEALAVPIPLMDSSECSKDAGPFLAEKWLSLAYPDAVLITHLCIPRQEVKPDGPRGDDRDD